MNFPGNKKERSGGIPPEIYSLAEEKLSGRISRTGLARLEELLRESPEALHYYLSLCAVEGYLQEALELHEKEALLSAEKQEAKKRSRFFRYAIGAGAIAALLVLFASGFWFVSRKEKTAPAAQIAATGQQEICCRVVSVFGATAGDQSIDEGTALHRGPFVMDKGLAELVFAKGARVLLEAPVSMEILGENSCRLTRGKAVTEVPNSAKGFVMESPDGRIVDYGTRFVVEIDPAKKRSFLGVLSGVVELEHEGKCVRLFADYAVEYGGRTIHSVPLEREKFLTAMPAREFPWNLDKKPLGAPQTLRFDVTPLMKIQGNTMHVIFKWLVGAHALCVEKLSLKHNGILIAESSETGITGKPENTKGNHIALQLPENLPPGGKWEIETTVICSKRVWEDAGLPASSRGVFLFERGLLENAIYKDFIGSWEHSHNGHSYVRELLPDGTLRTIVDGKESIPTDGRPLCEVEAGVLSITFRNTNTPPIKAMLRDKNTLIFLNQPWRNASRKQEEK